MAALSKLRLTAVSGAQHRGFTTDSSSGSCVRLRRRRVAVREWLSWLGVTTLFIEPGSPWENAECGTQGGKKKAREQKREWFVSP